MISKSKNFQVDLINSSIFRAVLIFSIPIFVSYIFQQLYNAADTAIIGNLLSEDSLIAVGACSALYELLVGFGIGFGNGLSIVAARAYGSGDIEKLRKITAASLIITVCVTAFIMLLTAFFLKPVMILLGTPEEILEESFSYIRIITEFCGVMFAYNLFSGLLRAIGNSFMPLVFLIFSSLMNVGLDIIFIQHFGVPGAAYATIISQGISALLCVVYIFARTRILIPSVQHFKFDGSLYADLAAQGLSMAFMGSIVHSGTVILQKGINSLDPLVIAGHLCARKIFTLTNIPIVTLGLSCSTFVSQNYGAGKFDRIKKGIKFSVLITLVWTLILFIPSLFFTENLVQLMSGSDSPVIISYADRYIRFMIPFYSVLGALIIIRNSLQALERKLLPLISSFIELAGKILFTALIIPRLGEWGVILCEPLIWCVMSAQLVFSFLRLPFFRTPAKN